MNHVQNWKTPELVIHGALDYRVVDTQGLATFNALQRLGVPSRLLYYPDENHWVLKPAQLDPVARGRARLDGSPGRHRGE